MFGLEIATLLLGISFIAAGMIQSRKTGQKKWRILMIIGIIPVLVSVFLLVCTFWLLYGIQVQELLSRHDLDHDGIKEIGISMADGEILWYHYREGLEDTWPENKCGCFEKVD